MLTTEKSLEPALAIVEGQLRNRNIIDKLWVVKLPKSEKFAVYCIHCNKDYFIKFTLATKDLDILPTTFDEFANIPTNANLEEKIALRVGYYINVLINTYQKINNIYNSGLRGPKPNKSYIDIGGLSDSIMKRTKAYAGYLVFREDEILEGLINWTYFNIPNPYQNWNPSYLIEDK